MIWGTWSLPSLHLQTNRPGSEKGGHLCHVLSIIKIGDVVVRSDAGRGETCLISLYGARTFIVSSPLDAIVHTHLCISLYTQILSMGRLRRDRCNFVKWFSSVLELIIFKFLFKTPIKILLNILINASYIFFYKYFSWTEHQCCSNYFFFLQNLHEKKPQNACIVSLLWFSVL